MKRTPSPRPFRLSDAMVLVMAMALSMAAIKFVDTFNGGLLKHVKRTELFGDDLSDRVVAWESLLSASGMLVIMFVTPLCVVLLGLRMRHPRPRVRRVWRQPGAAACLLCILLPLEWIIVLIGQAVIGRWSAIPWKEIDFDANMPGSSGILVLAVWIMFWLGRIGCPERSWIDRSGRAVGVVMILVYLIGTFGPEWLNATTPRYRLPTLPPDPPVESRPWPPSDLHLPPPDDHGLPVTPVEPPDFPPPALENAPATSLPPPGSSLDPKKSETP